MNSDSGRRSGSDIVLTGATGFVGKVVLYELLRRREELDVEKVRLLIRPGRNRDAATRFLKEIASARCFSNLDFDWQEYVEPVESDLSEPNVGIDADALAAMQESVTHVINCAASVQFDLPIAKAARANITTALEMLEFARACPRLECFLSVSTAYVTPHTSEREPVHEVLAPLPRDARDLYESILRGDVEEKALMLQSGHPNTYTLTKCIAEHLLVERQGDVPLAFVRPSIISASMERPSPGWIDSPAAFALFVVQIGAGRMRAVIARPESRLDVIPCDAVVDRVIDVAFGKGPPHEGDAPLIRHAVAGPDNSPMIRDCVKAVEEFFAQNPDTRRGNNEHAASVRYLGPDGLLYRLNHYLDALRPAGLRCVRLHRDGLQGRRREPHGREPVGRAVRGQ